MHFGEIASKPVSRTPAPRDGQWAQETPRYMETMPKDVAARSLTPGVCHPQYPGITNWNLVVGLSGILVGQMLPVSSRLNGAIY